MSITLLSQKFPSIVFFKEASSVFLRNYCYKGNVDLIKGKAFSQRTYSKLCLGSYQ